MISRDTRALAKDTCSKPIENSNLRSRYGAQIEYLFEERGVYLGLVVCFSLRNALKCEDKFVVVFLHGRIFRKRLQNERGDKIYHHNEQKHFSRTPFAAEKKPPLRILLPKICFKNYLSLTQCANKRPRNQRYRSTRQRRASILRIDTGSWLTSCLLYRLTRRIRRGETRRVLAEKRRS